MSLKIRKVVNKVMAAAAAVALVACIAKISLEDNPTYTHLTAVLKDIYCGIGSAIFIWGLYNLMRSTLVKDFKIDNMSAINKISLSVAGCAAIISALTAFFVK